MEHKLERIGKKYQWIAFHELIGRLSDIALVGGSSREEPVLYEGPWQFDTREMDPTILVTRTREWYSDRTGATWWSPHISLWRAEPPEARIAWMRDESRDVPDPVKQLDIMDPHGNRWLVLDIDVGRDHWVMIEGERTIQRRTWHKIRSILVSRDNVGKAERMFRNARSDHMFQHRAEVHGDGYLGEYPWHPAFDNIHGEWAIGGPESI